MTDVRRILGWALAMASLIGCGQSGIIAADTVLLPLPTQSFTASAVAEALMALRRGDVAPLEALPASAFSAPIAFPDEQRADLQRRWTAFLPEVLRGIDPAARARALATLDRLYGRSLSTADDASVKARQAVDYLPAPSAVAALTAAANRAFDHGAFEDFLSMSRLLEDAGEPNGRSDKRKQVALLLSGRGPDVDAGLALPPPGIPQPSAAEPIPDVPRLSVSWVTSPGWLLACDPWGRISWQYPIDRIATVVVGAGAALVQDSHGLRALSDNGMVTKLGPLPGGARVLAVAGAAAWFTTGTTAWRLELPSSRIQSLALGSVALAAPLVRGGESLWLTDHDLVLFDGDHLVARMRHGLPAAAGWYLASDRTHPLIISNEGQSWRLEALQEQLAHAAPLDKARLLLQAERWKEAAAVLMGTPDADSPAGKRALLRAHLGQGPDHVLGLVAELSALAQDAQEQVQIRQAAYVGAVKRTLGDATIRRSLLADLERLAREHPDILFSPCTLDSSVAVSFGESPTEWPVGLTGAGYVMALSDDAAAARPGFAGMVDPSAQPEPTAMGRFNEQRQPDGSTQYRQCQLILATHIDRKEVRCSREDGTLLWWHRWTGLSLLAAPSTSLMCRGGAVIVCEGQSQLRALSLFTGVQIGMIDLDDRLASLADVVVMGSGRMALLGPVGVNARMVITGEDTLAIDLPAPGRWLLASGSRVLVALQDGQVLAYPGGQAVALPAAIAHARTAPTAVARGLIVGDVVYPWSRHDGP